MSALGSRFFLTLGSFGTRGDFGSFGWRPDFASFTGLITVSSTGTIVSPVVATVASSLGDAALLVSRGFLGSRGFLN